MPDDQGTPAGVMAVVVETTAKVLAEQRREALARLADTLGELRDPAEMALQAARLLGEMLQASRVGYATVDPVHHVLHVLPHWNAPGVVPLQGEISLREYASFVDSLKRDEFVAIRDVFDDPRMRANAARLQSRGVRSLVNVPVVEQGRLVALFYVNQAYVRDWTPEELAFVREVAQRTRMAVERARGEAVVAELDQRFRALVTAGSDVVYRMSADWSQMQSLRGRDFIEDTDEASSNWLQRYIPLAEQPRVRAAIDEAIRTCTPFQLEHQVWQADGVIGWTLSRAIPILDASGRILEWFGAATDVSDRKRMEQELLDSQAQLREADRRKDEFLATLAHELRNPLAPIRNAAQLLKRGQGVPIDRVQAMLERQTDHMVRLVDDLMEVSRVSRGHIELQREPLPLVQVVDAALEAAREAMAQAGHRLDVQRPGTDVWVEGDPVRLTQVLVNLLNNAARYTEAGGKITLAAGADARQAWVSVSDNGIGLSAEQLPHLFEMFTQVSRHHSGAKGGLGIGLSLARRLMEMHGGTVTAHSEGLGRGSRFVATLPRTATPAAAVPAPPATAQVPPQRRILVVDDNRDAAESTALLLKALGAQVRVAFGGAQALETAARWRPDLVLLDLGMPEMDGHEVARRMLAQFGDERPLLVALTGWGQQQDREQTRRSGFDEHVVKPVDLAGLQRVMALAR